MTSSDALALLRHWAVAEANYRRSRNTDRFLQMQRVIGKIDELSKYPDHEQCRLIEEYLRATFTEVA